MSGEKRYSEEDVQRMFLEWRLIDPDGLPPCGPCGGSGVQMYGSTATWRGGCGGQMMTADVCDKCWGSGRKDRPWPTWRERKP